MITKAIIESVINNYSYKVRIPVYNRSKDAVFKTQSEQLYTAHVCCQPGLYPLYEVDDIVYVDFEDNNTGNPVILGLLLCEKQVKNSNSLLNINSIDIVSSAILPKNTQIGDISSTEIGQLDGVIGNIQRQIDILKN